MYAFTNLVKRPMDSMTLVAAWGKAESEAGISISIEGMLVQGCKCDGTRLSEAESTDPIFSSVPTFKLSWVPQEIIKAKGSHIPVYTNPSRENTVSNLMVPFGGVQAPWILAGVAFFISTE